MAVLEGSWFASGQSAADFHPDTTPVVQGAWFASGASITDWYGYRGWVARCVGAFTYDPLAGPVWDGTLRRDPEVIAQVATNDSPTSSSFTDEDEPALGSNVVLDFSDGHGVVGTGTVQSYTTRYEGKTDQLAHDVTVASYLWLLNKRRPFGCYTDTPADEVAEDLRVRFAPSDFSGAGIVSGLPNITVSFDGTLDYSGCMSVICARIAGYFKVDGDKVIYLFQDDPAPGPDVIDDNNQLLIRDQQLSIHRDISQIRNRVFVRGAAARLLAPSAVGATTLDIDGLDIFNPTGGEAIIGCDRFTYTGVLRTLIYPPPEASDQVPGLPSATDHLGRFSRSVVGPIRTVVKYSTSMVFDGKESPRSAEREFDYHRMSSSFGSLLWSFEEGAGFCPAGSHSWWFGVRATDGSMRYGQNGIATSRFVDGKYVFRASCSFPQNDLRPAEVVLFREATYGGVTDYHEVDSQPYVDGTVNYFLEDGKDDASLGNARPKSPDPSFSTFFQYDSVGARVYLLGSSLNLVSAFNQGASVVKVYRREGFDGGDAFTLPQLVMTLAPTDNPETYYEDTKQTSVLRFQVGESEVNAPSVTPPPAPPKVRLVLTGVSGLDEAHLEGDEVAIFIQRDDLTSQVDMAEIEGGDGLHEFMVVDTALRSVAELAVRGDAELQLFAQPIVTVNYSSFDPKHTPGGTVEFNLTRPQLVASLKITEVRIDKVHYEHGHVARYNVTASSVKFTLQDLLRRTILRPY